MAYIVNSHLIDGSEDNGWTNRKYFVALLQQKKANVRILISQDLVYGGAFGVYILLSGPEKNSWV